MKSSPKSYAGSWRKTIFGATMVTMMTAGTVVPQSSRAAQPAQQSLVFITLGTMGGPIAHPKRSQPANAIVAGPDVYLVDVGDGAAQRLAETGLRLNAVRGVFISHLHFDHTGGLGAVIGLRHQTNAPGVLTVYGPPGTKQLVDGIVASMQPGAEAGDGLPGAKRRLPESGVRVHELRGDATIELAGLKVTTAENTHYSFAPGSPEAKKFASLSLRFDGNGRSLVYTGDTGPSAQVERLARGADLLVSEMIDLRATLAAIRRNSPNMPAELVKGVSQHLEAHHLSPEQVGQLAARAGVRRVVVTHIVPGAIDKEEQATYLAGISKHFKGPAEIADDLDRF